MLRLSNIKTRTAMNVNILVLVLCVEGIIYLPLSNVNDSTFNLGFKLATPIPDFLMYISENVFALITSLFLFKNEIIPSQTYFKVLTSVSLNWQVSRSSHEKSNKTNIQNKNAECVVYFIIKAIHEILRINWMKQWLDFLRSVERCFSMYIVKILKIFLQTLVANFGERKMYIHNFFTEHLRATAFVVSSIPFNLAKLGAQPGNFERFIIELRF